MNTSTAATAHPTTAAAVTNASRVTLDPAAPMSPRHGVPSWIARDTHAGRWTRWGVPAHLAAGVYTAAELAATADQGIIWESFGHVDGREGFARTRYVAGRDGSIGCYDSDGRLVLVHPADRQLRILVSR